MMAENEEEDHSPMPHHYKPTQIIKLNIGGYRYESTVSTITRIKDTFFSALLSDRLETTKDDLGAYFIDRDGQFFAPILTFLRTDELAIPSSMTIKDVKREAAFYSIAPLLSLLEDEENKIDSQISSLPLETSHRHRNRALEEIFGSDDDNWMNIYIQKYLRTHHDLLCSLLKDLRNEYGALQVLLHVCTGEHEPRLESLKVWRGRQIYSNPLGISIGLECKTSPWAVELIADHLMEKGFSGRVWHSQSIHCNQCSSSSTNILLCWNHHYRTVDDFFSCCKQVTDYRFGSSLFLGENV